MERPTVIHARQSRRDLIRKIIALEKELQPARIRAGQGAEAMRLLAASVRKAGGTVELTAADQDMPVTARVTSEVDPDQLTVTLTYDDGR